MHHPYLALIPAFVLSATVAACSGPAESAAAAGQTPGNGNAGCEPMPGPNCSQL